MSTLKATAFTSPDLEIAFYAYIIDGEVWASAYDVFESIKTRASIRAKLLANLESQNIRRIRNNRLAGRPHKYINLLAIRTLFSDSPYLPWLEEVMAAREPEPEPEPEPDRQPFITIGGIRLTPDRK